MLTPPIGGAWMIQREGCTPKILLLAGCCINIGTVRVGELDEFPLHPLAYDYDLRLVP